MSSQVKSGYVLVTDDASLPIERCLPVGVFDANQRRRPACSGHIEWPSVIRLSSLDSYSVFDNATGQDFVNQIDAALACRTGALKYTSGSTRGRDHRRVQEKTRTRFRAMRPERFRTAKETTPFGLSRTESGDKRQYPVCRIDVATGGSKAYSHPMSTLLYRVIAHSW